MENITNSKYWYKIKLLIPNKLYEPILSSYYSLRSLKYYGNNVTCPVCGNSFRTFIKVGKYGTCPKCGARSRHRLLYLFLKNSTNFYVDKLNVLHFAPAHCFFDRFKSLQNLDYLSADINSPRAMEKIDMTNIRYPDNYFDVIISSHVLEHIQEDIRAMQELYRVLKIGGWSVHNVPIDYSRKKTYENSQVNTPEERLKYFGHFDHKRIYGTDYKDRLESAGFLVEIINVMDFVSIGDQKKYSIDEKGKIYLCRKK